MRQSGAVALRRGVTLVEMLIVVVIVSVMAGLTFPAVTNGLDSIRLRSAADSVAAFLNGAMNRAQRRGEVVEVVVDPAKNRLALYSTAANFNRTLDLPQGITLHGETARSVLLLPGASFPRFAIDVFNGRGIGKHIGIEPITGAPRITDIQAVPQ